MVSDNLTINCEETKPKLLFSSIKLLKTKGIAKAVPFVSRPKKLIYA